MDLLTPVQDFQIEDAHAGKRCNLWLKRDDLWDECGVARGGKARTAGAICRALIEHNIVGAVCCLDRNSSVPGMLSRVFKHYGRSLDIFIPKSKLELSGPFAEAVRILATLHEVYPGYMSVRQKAAREFAEASWIKPLGTIGIRTCLVQLGVGLYYEGIGEEETARQVQNLPQEIKRIVVPVGSGGMLQGIADGVIAYHDGGIPILGVCCGNRPKREYPDIVALVDAGVPFNKEGRGRIGPVELDPVYEAKCLPFLEDGDLLWIVAHRSTE